MHHQKVDRARPPCRFWIAVDGYRRRTGQGMVVPWRIAPRPEPRAAALVSIHEVKETEKLGGSKDFQHHRIFGASWNRWLLADNQG